MKTKYTSYDESEILGLFSEASPVAPPAPDDGAATPPVDAAPADQSQPDQGADEKPAAQDDHLLDQSDDVKEQFKNIDNVNELIEFIFSNKTLTKKVIKWWNKRKESDQSQDDSSAPADQSQGQDQSAAPAPAQNQAM